MVERAALTEQPALHPGARSAFRIVSACLHPELSVALTIDQLAARGATARTSLPSLRRQRQRVDQARRDPRQTFSAHLQNWVVHWIGLGAVVVAVRVLGSSPRSPPDRSPGRLLDDRSSASEATTRRANAVLGTTTVDIVSPSSPSTGSSPGAPAGSSTLSGERPFAAGVGDRSRCRQHAEHMATAQLRSGLRHQPFETSGPSARLRRILLRARRRGHREHGQRLPHGHRRLHPRGFDTPSTSRVRWASRTSLAGRLHDVLPIILAVATIRSPRTDIFRKPSIDCWPRSRP